MRIARYVFFWLLHSISLSSHLYLFAFKTFSFSPNLFASDLPSFSSSFLFHLPLSLVLSRPSPPLLLRDPDSTSDPLDPTAEPSSGLESPSNSLRQWTIGPVRATSHGSVTPRRDDRVEPVLVLRCVRWIQLLMIMGLVPTSLAMECGLNLRSKL